MSNRFLDKKAYLDGLTPMTARSRASTLVKAASKGGNAPSISMRNRFGLSVPMATDERALVVLLENGGVDLGVGTLVDHLLSAVPGGSRIPGRDSLVNYIDEKIRDVTDNLLESAELVINRYSAAAPDPYGSVHVLRNGSALYNSLKTKLIELTEANKIIDLMVLTHGTDDYIALEGSDYITGDKIRQIRTVHNGGKPIRLRSVYMMNCVGSTLNQAWLDIGAKTSAGAVRNNYIPEPTTYYFFRNWKAGQSFDDAVLNAYDSTINAIEGFITTGLRTAIPGTNLIPGFDGLVESIADIENRQFILDSAPVVSGDGSLTMTSDALAYSQSSRTRSYTFVPMSRSHSRLQLPRAMQVPERIMTHQISSQAVDFIKSFEGFRGDLYDDPAGHCTIGYGHLVHRGNCDGRQSEAEFVGGVTQAQATALMRGKLAEFEAAVNEHVTARLEPNQFDALVSFTYNIGIGRPASGNQSGTGFRGSTLLRRLNGGDYNAVPSEMARWNKAGATVLPGLTRRRAAEGRMFSSGDYSTTQSVSFRHRSLEQDGDPIALASLETEGDERPDGDGVAASMQLAISAHCPVNSATTAGTANFALSEFASRDGAATPNGLIGNIQVVMEQLEVLRAELGGGSITVVSGYRSPAHNTSVGGATRSQHMCGRASDIRVANYTPAQVHAAIERLIGAGRMMQGGLGLYNSFVHYDTRGVRQRWDNSTPKTLSLTSDPIADAAQETEGDEAPDRLVNAYSMQVAGPAGSTGTAHFALSEFASKDGVPTPQDAVANLQIVMQQLEVLRTEVGDVPITVVSGYRSPAHNTSVGGAARSQHLYGRAADIKIADHTPSQVHAIIERLIGAGRMLQGGLGLYPDRFVHYDTRGSRARWTG